MTDKPAQTKCEWHAEKIENLEHTVYGNGQEGLKTGVIKLREHVRLLLWLYAIIASALIMKFVGDVWGKITGP